MNDIGKLIKELRLDKQLTQAELSSGILSRSHLSELENGKYHCSYEKFIFLLKRLNISPSEFDYLLGNSVYRDEENLKRQTMNIINSQDVNVVNEYCQQLKQTLTKNTKQKEHLLLLCEAVTEYQQLGEICNRDKYQPITHYLFQTKNWHIYEMELLNNFLLIYSDEDLDAISKLLMKKVVNSTTNLEITKLLVKIYYNLSSIYLHKENSQMAKKYSNMSNQLASQNHWLFEGTLARLNNGIINIMENNENDQLFIECCDFLLFHGYEDIVDRARKIVDSL